MEKDVVNNEIVLMRKVCTQAKRYFVTRFTKRKKQILLKHGESDDPATKNRLEDIKCILTMVKAIKADDISKLALAENKTSLKNMINNSSTPQSQKLLARIASNKSVQDNVLKFKNAHPTHKQWIKPTLELWEARKSKKEKKKQAKQVQQAKSVEPKAKAKKIKVSQVDDKADKSVKTNNEDEVDSKNVLPEKTKSKKNEPKKSESKKIKHTKATKSKDLVKKMNPNSKVAMKMKVKKQKAKLKTTKSLMNAVKNL